MIRKMATRVAYHLGSILPEFHQSPFKTLCLLVTTMSHLRKASVAGLARALPTLRDLEGVYKRVRQFLRYSRFTTEEVYASVCLFLLERLAHLDPGHLIPVLLDWTDYKDLMGLHLALCYKGRALPLFCKILPKSLAKGSMTAVEVELLEQFFKALPELLRPKIIVLADRGFCKLELLGTIRSFGAHYGIRSPRHRHILIDGSWKTLQSIELEPGQKKILLHSALHPRHPFPVNVAIRRLKEGQANDPDDDVWYILTDLDPAETALGLYEKRMWIEEMFRDFKNTRNGFHLEKHLVKSPEIFEKLILVISLTYLVLIQEGANHMGEIPLSVILRKRKDHPDLSVLQIAIALLDKVLQDLPTEPWQAFLRIWRMAA
jgi:hypothetical protein